MIRNYIEEHLPGIPIKEYSSKRIAIVVEGNSRDEWFRKLESLGGTWDKTPDSRSSLGWVKFHNGQVTVKPKHRQGPGSSGVGNEILLIEGLRTLLRK